MDHLPSHGVIPKLRLNASQVTVPAVQLMFAVFAALVIALLSCPVGAQETSEADVHIAPRESAAKSPTPNSLEPALDMHTEPLVKDVDLVLVPVTITDSDNRPVSGMERENFQVYEAGRPQYIQNFSSEDAPISLGVILDASGSMKDKINQARDAVVEFFKSANPQDEFLLITVGDRPELLSPFTQNVGEIQNRLMYLKPKGSTALMDAIYLGMSKMKSAKHQRKALLIISDGGDNHSRYTVDDIKDLIKESDVQAYAIGIFDNIPKTTEERLGPSIMSEITSISGGRTFAVANPDELTAAAAMIGNLLRNQYVLGYRASNTPHDGKWHKIKVKLALPKGLPPMHVAAKTGYYAPSQ